VASNRPDGAILDRMVARAFRPRRRDKAEVGLQYRYSFSIRLPRRHERAVQAEFLGHGSNREARMCNRQIGFTPTPGHDLAPRKLTFCAITRLMRRNKIRRHSINSSARMRSCSGKSIPSAFAVLIFTSKLILVGNSTGRSAGLVPLTIWWT
jgi:hypothetical protein